MVGEQTVEDIKTQVTEQVSKVVANINNIDSKKEKCETVIEVLNQVIAGVELSKIEKAGVMVTIQHKRVG